MPRRTEPRTRLEPGTYPWFRKELGRFLYRINPQEFDAGPNVAHWSPNHIEAAHSLIQQGEHQLYHTPGHDWTFLKPEFVLHLATGQFSYDMADDFDGVLSEKLMFDEEDNGYDDCIKVHPRVIRDRRSYQTDTNSFPNIFAEEATAASGHEHQQYRLLFWPTPSQAYTLRGQYRVRPVYMDENRIFPYGGPRIQQALLYSILMIAEQQHMGQIGDMGTLYQERLQEAVNNDGRTHGPKILGYNGNGPAHSPRNGYGMRDGLRFENFSNATYNGTDYGS